MPASVDILLTAFNGEAYISDQIDSILRQSFQDWRLLIRDDGSTDDTVSIIEQYCSKYPEKIIFLNELKQHLGVTQSFSYLINNSSSDYIAFCDQDDVWKSYKLEKQMAVMLETEEKKSRNLAVLVHSDLEVVDENLAPISPSLWAFQNIDPYRMNSLKKLLMQNYVTGCASLLNKVLIEMVKEMPQGVILHDWWSALIASSKGEIISMPEATILYRQHANNETGAFRSNVVTSIFRVIRNRRDIRRKIYETVEQAKALVNSNYLDREKRKLVEIYINLFNHGWFKRRFLWLSHGFNKNGLLRNLGMMIFM